MANILGIDDYFDYLTDEVSNYVENRIITFEGDSTKFFLKMIFFELLLVSFSTSFVLKN